MLKQEEHDAREDTSLLQRIERGIADARDIQAITDIMRCKHLTPSMVHHMLNAFCWGMWEKSANDIQRLVRVLASTVNIRVRVGEDGELSLWTDKDSQDPTARIQVLTMVPETQIVPNLYVDWYEPLEILAFKYDE